MTTNSQDWKAKYLDLLDQQELLEQQSQADKDLYQNLSKKLIIAAQGQAPSMDEVLQAIRKELSQEKHFPALLPELEQQVLKLDQDKERQQEALNQALYNLTQQLLATKPNTEISKTLKSLAKTAQRQASAADFEQLATLYRAEPEDQANSPKASLLGRLFNKEKPASEPELEVTKQTSESAQESSGDGQVLSRVVAILMQLVEKLPLGKSWYQQLEQVVSQLRKGIQWQQLPSLLQQISQLVIAASEQEQNQFENFLQELEQKLQGLNANSAVLEQHQRQISDASGEFHQGLSADVSIVGQTVAQATDLEQVKTGVADLVGRIHTNLDDYQTEQSQREQLMVDEINGLNQRLAELEAQAKQAQQTLDQERQQLLQDSLTELPNRAAYDRRVEEELERWRRYQRKAVFAVADIDFFKKINDTHGHLTGDKVLKAVAKIMRQRLRTTDFVARYGGEEFVIIMAETELGNAIEALNLVRQSVASSQFKFKQQEFNVSMSFGLTEFRTDDTAETVFQRADEALYKAKSAGRNQCQTA